MAAERQTDIDYRPSGHPRLADDCSKDELLAYLFDMLEHVSVHFTGRDTDLEEEAILLIGRRPDFTCMRGGT